MQLNSLIAKQIVDRAKKIIAYSINVMDENGVIIGSSDPSRLHQTHEGALLAIRDNRTIEINDSVASTLSGVKTGINLPIIYSEHVIGVVGISGTPEEVRSYGELVKMTAELIVEQAALMSQVQWNKRHREELLLQLIEGSSLNDGQLLSIAQRLDLDLSQPRVATVIKVIPRAGEPVTLEHLQKLVHLLEHPERDNIVGIASVSMNEIVVLKPVTIVNHTWNRKEEQKRVAKLVKRIDNECDFSIQMAIGDYFPGLIGLARSYETAKATIESSTSNDDAVMFYQDRKLSVLVSSIKQDPWRATQLKAPIEKLMAADSKQVLLKTLSTFFAQNCDLAQTCESLHIHRNTLRYRLDKIQQETNLDINKLDDKIQLYLALKCL
ncbi:MULTISPECIES: sugar diacid recognition domain-containing protein [Vibrio]|uniref:XRE family transcriptional regulator n=1 Tax=Vibrio mediterranei TaxID=689 RepID=A0A3G4VBZ5_9VIBR|nr:MULTISPECIES: sugar diacid recognition domain-containing protein [Vibrio]AYV21809.1 XRE family transcriptional regulator [Vibrio mediterranei]MCF4171975.1 helix-turn-helix domain-containing protein [Vibrio sp. McD22-P3]MCG9665692.1 helix-turn-helix domain-containing protein [Vibrio mediterranei]MDA0109752.1 helix-turn-helix domain-containing protein [Vibrio sp. La 4.2.2]NOI21786.1 XRE family transcriptional regulator [Vibrio mediterranei]